MVEPPVSFDGGPYIPMSQLPSDTLKDFIFVLTCRPPFVRIYNEDGYDEDFLVRYATRLLKERGL